MSILLARKAIEETAMRNGVPTEDVYMEIQSAIDSAMKSVGQSLSESSRSFTPEEVICIIAELIDR